MSGRGKRILPQNLQKKYGLADALLFMSSLQHWEKKFLLFFLATRFMALCYSSHRRLIHQGEHGFLFAMKTVCVYLIPESMDFPTNLWHTAHGWAGGLLRRKEISCAHQMHQSEEKDGRLGVDLLKFLPQETWGVGSKSSCLTVDCRCQLFCQHKVFLKVFESVLNI